MRPQPCAEAHRQLFNNNYFLLYHIFNPGAGDRTRTYDPLITKAPTPLFFCLCVQQITTHHNKTQQEKRGDAQTAAKNTFFCVVVFFYIFWTFLALFWPKQHHKKSILLRWFRI